MWLTVGDEWINLNQVTHFRVLPDAGLFAVQAQLSSSGSNLSWLVLKTGFASNTDARTWVNNLIVRAD